MPRVTSPEKRPQDLQRGEPVGSALPERAICARVDGHLVDLSWPVDRDVAVEPVFPEVPEGLHVLRHSTAHVMAQAVCDLYPGAK